MKKKIFLSVFVILLIFSLTLIILAEEQIYDFRKTNWGMNKEQVKAIENKNIIYEGDNNLGHVITYEVEIGIKSYYCIYYFLEDKLYTAGYMSIEEYSNKNDYIRDYEEIKEILTKKYGEPDNKKLLALHGREEISWEDDLYRDDKNNWGLAISIGDLSYVLICETPTTDIELILDGNNYEVNLRVRYISKELKEWADKIKEEKIKSEF